MKQQAPEACAAFVGLDWADATHAICLQAAGSAHRECLHLAHRPEVIDAWGQSLRTRFNGQPVAVCLELHKGPLVSALCNYAFLVLFPVHPLTVAKYREAFPPSRAKDDPTDSIDSRIQALKSATPLTTDEGVMAPSTLLGQALVSQPRVPLQAIKDFDDAMAQPPGRSWLPDSWWRLANNGNAPPLL